MISTFLISQVFIESSMPVVDYYEQKGKVRRFNSDRDPKAIYAELRTLFLDL